MKFLRKRDDNEQADEILSIANDDETMMPLSSFKTKQSMYARTDNQIMKGSPAQRLKVLIPLMLAIPLQIVVSQMSHGPLRPLAPVLFFGFLAAVAWVFRAPLRASNNSFSHLLVSDKGVRLHNSKAFQGMKFLRRFDWTSPLIPWEAFTYADTAPAMLPHSAFIFGDYKAPPEVLNPHNGTTLRLHVNLECMPVLDARKFSKSKQSKATILIMTDALAERDIVQLVGHLRRHLPKESIHETADAYAPAQLWQDYTTIWLQQLNDNSRVATLPSGTVLKGRDDSYEIIDRLGSGGQAVTYTAKKSDGEVVVLKEFVLPSTGGQEVVRNTMTHITKEAQLLQSLDHPQIVKCHGWFSSGRRAYLALSLLEGKTLRQVVKDHGPVPEATVRQYAKQMCTLLEYLHSMSPPVVHRDFTPDNLMVNDKGQLFLMDFDVARHLESQTATRTVVGKHNYMPPEQFRGQATAQSDLYALGCTLHWLLTGQDPEPITTCHPKQLRPEISETLDAIVSKATTQDASKRYQNAAEIEDAIAARSGVPG